MIPTKEVLSVPVTCLKFEEQVLLMMRWAKARVSKTVCLANVHMLMEAKKTPAFANVLRKADLVTPDGKPLVLMLRSLGVKDQNQVAGFDVFLNLCALSEKVGTSVYFLGSDDEMLGKIREKLNREYPVLKIAGMKSPPKMSIEEILQKTDHDLVQEINQSGAGIVFVCLGCPKQEIWMSQYQDSIQSVMVGVGAAFSMYAGENPRAPYWMQQAYLEWLYRLLQEPRRLWRRYGSTIPPFMYLAIKDLVTPYKEKLSRARWRKTPRNIAVDIEKLDFSHEKIGEILVRQGAVARHQLAEALEFQQEHPHLRLGEILVRRNLLLTSQLKFHLKNQNIRFGEFLLEKKALKRRCLEKILATVKNSELKLGEAILKQNLVSEERLKELMVEYYTRRKGLYLAEELPHAVEIPTDLVTSESA